VAHVTFGLDVGGLERLLIEFGRHADRERFELHFVSLGTRGVLAGEIEALGWPVLALDEPTGLHLGLVPRLTRFFRGWGADVVHTHENRALFYAAPAARLARVPRVVHTRHGLSFGASRREQQAFPYLARLVDRVVCISDDCAADSVRAGVHPGRVQTIWNGIDLSRFAYTGPQDDGPLVIVARLNPVKDIGTLLRALAIAIREEPSLRLEIAGDGPSRAELEQAAHALGLEAAVRFLGEVQDVPAVLRRARAFVLSSVSEGISLTLLEAMARGLPIVATRVGGNPEVIVDDETGWLVPAGDPDALAGAILRLWRDPERGRQMGQAGRHRVEQHFEIRRMVADYEEIYAQGRGRRRTRVAPARIAEGPRR
jgi:sugar transferase (PEP-CTERM/EpsH1 system associated)